MVCPGYDPRVRVVAPNFKRRLSGVTATVVRLVPVQAARIPIRAAGPALPAHVPQIPLSSLPFLPMQPAVWHARRNVEMLGGLALRHGLRKPLKLLFTSASQRRHTGLTKWLIRRQDAVVATSHRSAAYLEVPCDVIMHGIDTDAFRPAPDRAALRARLGLPPDGTVVGCFGRIRAQKGTDAFVDALLTLLPDRPYVTGIVMGRAVDKDRAFLDDLRSRIGTAGLSDRLRILPEVPVDAMAEWYAALDLYVAPQRWEGFGLTPLEAAACGVPSVATRVGAFEDLVCDGTTGLLVPPDDTPAMARAMAGLLDDPARLAAMGGAARARAESMSLSAEGDALIAIYRRLLGLGG
ncbi:glycosyltransferase family 4 protein [Oceaniovalibus guishaninsula]|uniref:glycosyltransferase family 4 protein n=1 Tax=Oceaniovalibus guishaninsula TaxID=1046117 RepID=UPI00058C6543|nr:glycosyltransferase family 4 protein [Oceaniovalibus guishaninsula]